MDNQTEPNKIKLTPFAEGVDVDQDYIKCLEVEANLQHLEKVKAIKAELDNNFVIDERGNYTISREDFDAIFNEALEGK